jgi:hypothetical protein
MLLVCDACLLLALHRSRAVFDLNWRKQASVYVGLFLIAGTGFIWIGILVKKNAQQFARDVSAYVVAALQGKAHVDSLPVDLIKQEQDEVFDKLSGDIKFPASGDIFASRVTFTNGSTHALGKHALVCWRNLITDTHGTRQPGFGTVVAENRKDGALLTPRFSIDKLPFISTPIGPSGDVATDKCLSPWAIDPVINETRLCVDVTTTLYYEIADQSGIIKQKAFRYIGIKNIKSGTDEGWERESLATKVSPCEL